MRALLLAVALAACSQEAEPMALIAHVDVVPDGDDVWLIAGQSNSMQTANVADMPVPDQPLATPLATVRYAGRTYASAIDVTPADWGWIDLGPTNSGTKHGLELAFGAALGANHSILKFAIGGTSLETWESEGRADDMVAWIDSKLSTYDGGTKRVAGMVWCQGESDNTEALAAQWATRFSAIVATVRAGVDRRRMPVILIQTSEDIAGAGVATLRSQQAAWVAADAHAVMINTDAYVLGGDGLHWASENITNIGELAAAEAASPP